MLEKTIILYEYTDIIKPENKELLNKIISNYINTENNARYEYICEYYNNNEFLEKEGFNIQITSFDLDRNNITTIISNLNNEQFLNNLNLIEKEKKHILKVCTYCNEDVIDATSRYYKGSYPRINKLMIKLSNLICDYIDDIKRTILKELKNEYELLTSNEYILETININNYTFNSKGFIEA